MVAIEPLVIAFVVFILWLPDLNRVWVFLLLIPVYVARVIAYRRLATLNPLVILICVFLLLCIINIYAAPYRRGLVLLTIPLLELEITPLYAWTLLGRPLMGLALVISLVEFARRRDRINGILLACTGAALLVAGLALTGSQWNEKADQMRFLINLLPVYMQFPGAEGGFNANEIAGALSWFTPLMAALAIYRWRARLPRIGVTVAFFALLLALFLGQSRFALFGVIGALGILIFLLIPPGRWRVAALLWLGVFVLLQFVVMSNIFNPNAERMRERDEDSVTSRLAIWASGLAMLRDHPLTGVGMNMYRAEDVRTDYPVEGYQPFTRRILPHAHNEFIQVGADLGVPGLLVFSGFYAAVAWMLWRVWQRGDDAARAAAAGCAAALLAHGVYGMGDAVALWDRFTWVFWLILGVAAALYTQSEKRLNLVTQGANEQESV
jgi:O-antigen ligase